MVRAQSLQVNALAWAAFVAVLASGNAHAFQIDAGNPDLAIQWDNTVRFNSAVRAEDRDDKIGNTAIADEGTYRFDQGDFVANRLDLLSEFDVVYKKLHGARVSAAGWYDAAYSGSSRTNPNPPLTNIPSYINKQYSDYTKRYYYGPSGEILDAFVFTGGDVGDVPVRAKLGRHTVYWGESLFLGGNLHSVAYAQNPLDLQKGFSTPGTEAKELFRPLNQLSGQAQVTDDLSVAAQYMFEWESFRYPEGGTYLGPVDFVFNGPDRQFLSPALGFAARGKPSEPQQHGEFGLSARWSPEWLDGTMGAYYRNFSDKLPQTFVTQAGPNRSQYNLIYTDDIDLFGISLAKNIGGVSVGGELSYRHNTPLNSTVLGIAARPAGQGRDQGPAWRHHARRGQLPRHRAEDAGVRHRRLGDRVHLGALEQGVAAARTSSSPKASPACVSTNRSKWDGCTTKNFFGFAASFTPTWFQVFPGVDLYAPVTYAVGLKGNAPTVFGGNQGNGNYSLGLGADVRQKYRFDLKYIDFVGKYKDNGTSVTSQNGLTTLLKDRGFVSLTFKTTF